ncbi:MAG TPA: 3-phosphoserine/phosphohydroxythreonine transaminase [Vicinamibacterales bacterium]|jgi:phosphoserine aminotransferase|nr:3-phosphoserine/phosphohydroxythreonine transaminase [Vicinamibacterales bacterium]
MPVHRVYNFSAGPAVLPLSVLEEAQRDLVALPGVGMSVLEISHRSKTFDAIIQAAEADLRTLGSIPANYKVLFLQGGASLQFAMVPMNLLTSGAVADYILTGSWSKKALKEAKLIGATHVAASTEEGGFKRVPAANEIKLTPGAAYVHMTSNNTIAGTEWHHVPETTGAPLVCDASSDIFSRPIDISKFGLVYAGAQKNLGPSGVTVVIIREDLLARSSDTLPAMLNYKTQADAGSMYNTPPVFGIYTLGLVLKWLVGQGGLTAIAKVNERKAKVLYDELDRTPYWRPHAEKDSRSLMNVTFRLPSEDLEKQFIKDAAAAGFDGLKGHRSVGGLRASIYNAFPEEGVKALVEFMREFEKKNG